MHFATISELKKDAENEILRKRGHIPAIPLLKQICSQASIPLKVKVIPDKTELNLLRQTPIAYLLSVLPYHLEDQDRKDRDAVDAYLAIKEIFPDCRVLVDDYSVAPLLHIIKDIIHRDFDSPWGEDTIIKHDRDNRALARIIVEEKIKRFMAHCREGMVEKYGQNAGHIFDIARQTPATRKIAYERSCEEFIYMGDPPGEPDPDWTPEEPVYHFDGFAKRILNLIPEITLVSELRDKDVRRFINLSKTIRNLCTVNAGLRSGRDKTAAIFLKRLAKNEIFPPRNEEQKRMAFLMLTDLVDNETALHAYLPYVGFQGTAYNGDEIHHLKLITKGYITNVLRELNNNFTISLTRHHPNDTTALTYP